MRSQNTIIRSFVFSIVIAVVSVEAQEPLTDEIVSQKGPTEVTEISRAAEEVSIDQPRLRPGIVSEPDVSIKRLPNPNFSVSADDLRKKYSKNSTEDENFAKFLEQYDRGLVEKPKKRQSEKNFNWSGAVWQQLFFLGIQHGVRLTEEKTRRELDGPFFQDWFDSVKNLEGWDDGGKFFTNYIAHPLQGAASSRIFLNNHASGNKAEFGDGADYWESRLKAAAWSAVWNLQFEIGPISEASIGNVGQSRHLDGRSKMTWGDIVVTPVGGFVFNVAEDIVDKYVLKRWIEKGGNNKVTVPIKIVRSFFTPLMSFTNLLRMRMPWYRDHRVN